MPTAPSSSTSGTPADGAHVVARLAAAKPDGTPGGTYEQALTRAADIRNYDEMGSLPIVLTALLAAAALLAVVTTLFAAPRARRHDLAVLKTIGLERSQVRGHALAQALITVAIALIVGIPLGIVAGRLTWSRYAHDIGVLPEPDGPECITILAIAAGTAALCALLSLRPAAVLARTPRRTSSGPSKTPPPRAHTATPSASSTDTQITPATPHRTSSRPVPNRRSGVKRPEVPIWHVDRWAADVVRAHVLARSGSVPESAVSGGGSGPLGSPTMSLRRRARAASAGRM